MLFGFGERGFSPHRFLMNELEEPVTVGVLRRLEMTNIEGARRRLVETGGRPLLCPACAGRPCEQACQRTRWAGTPVAIAENLLWVEQRTPS